MKKLLLPILFALFIIGCEKQEGVINENGAFDTDEMIKAQSDYLNLINTAVKPVNIIAENSSFKSAASCELVNGSFETGDFSGWNVLTTGSPFRPWGVFTENNGGGFGMAQTDPQDGIYVAANGFDGGGPMTFELWQDVELCSCAELTWMDRIQWDYRLGGNASIPRTFDVQLRDPSDNSIIETIYSFSTGTQAENPTGDTGWQTHVVDISSYAGSNVRFHFIETIPQSFTGPAQMEFDAIGFVETDTDGDD